MNVYPYLETGEKYTYLGNQNPSLLPNNLEYIYCKRINAWTVKFSREAKHLLKNSTVYTIYAPLAVLERCSIVELIS